MLVYRGLDRVAVPSASAGDIVLLTGLDEVAIGDTLADPESPDPLPRIAIDEPTVRMTFGVNTSPFTGREGRFSTSRQLRARLYKELDTNLGLHVEDMDRRRGVPGQRAGRAPPCRADRDDAARGLRVRGLAP